MSEPRQLTLDDVWRYWAIGGFATLVFGVMLGAAGMSLLGACATALVGLVAAASFGVLFALGRAATQ